MDREPAPMAADFATLIAEGVVDLAEMEDDVVGFVVHYARGNCMQLENIAVLPSYSGQGIGKHLMDHVEACASQLGLTAIELYTNEAMTENQSYYPRQGYLETRREEQAGFKRVFYRKPLD